MGFGQPATATPRSLTWYLPRASLAFMSLTTAGPRIPRLERRRVRPRCCQLCGGQSGGGRRGGQSREQSARPSGGQPDASKSPRLHKSLAHRWSRVCRAPGSRAAGAWHRHLADRSRYRRVVGLHRRVGGSDRSFGGACCLHHRRCQASRQLRETGDCLCTDAPQAHRGGALCSNSASYFGCYVHLLRVPSELVLCICSSPCVRVSWSVPIRGGRDAIGGHAPRRWVFGTPVAFIL